MDAIGDVNVGGISGRRCGARGRDGAPCPNPPIPGKRRCRLHGGAPGTGAPKGNRNAFKHGVYTAEGKALRKEVMDFVRASNHLMEEHRARRAYVTTRRLRRWAKAMAAPSE